MHLVWRTAHVMGNPTLPVELCGVAKEVTYTHGKMHHSQFVCHKASLLLTSSPTEIPVLVHAETFVIV